MRCNCSHGVCRCPVVTFGMGHGPVADPIELAMTDDGIRAAIVAAIVNEEPLTIVYTSKDDKTTVRPILPSSIARCDNGNTVVRARDLAKREARTFSLSGVLAAGPAF